MKGISSPYDILGTGTGASKTSGACCGYCGCGTPINNCCHSMLAIMFSGWVGGGVHQDLSSL